MHMSFRLASLGAAALLVAACSSDNGGALVTPTTHYNLAVEVTPAALPTIAEDDSAMFDADVRDVDTKLVVPDPDGWKIVTADDNISITQDEDGHYWVHAVGPNSSSFTVSAKNMNKDSTISLTVPVTITPVPVGSVVIDSVTLTFKGDTTPTAVSAPIALYSDSVNGGDQVVLQATVVGTSSNPLPARLRTWTSRDEAVATVGSDGTVTAAGPGTTYILATADGVSDSVQVNVTTRPVASVVVTPASDTLAVGGNVTLSAMPMSADNKKLPDRKVTWATDNPLIAVVSNSGVVTAMAGGTAHISATADGKTGTATVVVVQ